MAIQYPDGTVVNATFTGATKTNIVNNINTHLKTAGWTAISGDGTGDVILESATTPTAENKIRVRLRDSNLTNCACLNMQNASASKVSQNYFLLPAAAKTFRIIANKYQFFCFTAGASASREFLAMGTLYIPSFLHGVVTGELGWISGNATSDTDGTARNSFRNQLHSGVNGNSSCWHSALVNNNLINADGGGNNNTAGGMRLIVSVGAFTDTVNGYRWHDDSLQICDPLIAWGLTSPNSDEAKIRGQMFGAMIVTDSFAADTILSSVDGHDWHGITNSNSGSSGDSRGTLFVATT